MDTVSGFAAIEQRKETANMFAGKLTPDLLTLMEQRITEAQTATATRMKIRLFLRFMFIGIRQLFWNT